MQVTNEIAQKVLSVVDAGLVNGLGKPQPGQMCVEAAVCYALGLPHGDDPKCVAPSLRHLKIKLNDSHWSSAKARAAGLRRLALVQLGSAGTLDEKEFVARCAMLSIRTCVPVALRAAATRFEGEKSDALLEAANRCEAEPTLENAWHAREAAFCAAHADAAYAAAAAADAADAASTASTASKAAFRAARSDSAYAAAASANAAAVASANAASAADAAASYAASYAAEATASAADASAFGADKILSDFAEGVVQILIDMDVPGVQWLSLTETVTPYFARPS